MKDFGIDVVTRVRKSMLEVVHSEFDQALLRKRSLLETVFDELKKLCQIEHTRNRSPMNFAVNLMAGIVAYCLQPVKPRIAVWDCRTPWPSTDSLRYPELRLNIQICFVSEPERAVVEIGGAHRYQQTVDDHHLAVVHGRLKLMYFSAGL